MGMSFEEALNPSIDVMYPSACIPVSTITLQVLYSSE